MHVEYTRKIDFSLEFKEVHSSDKSQSDGVMGSMNFLVSNDVVPFVLFLSPLFSFSLLFFYTSLSTIAYVIMLKILFISCPLLRHMLRIRKMYLASLCLSARVLFVPCSRVPDIGRQSVKEPRDRGKKRATEKEKKNRRKVGRVLELYRCASSGDSVLREERQIDI